MPGPITVQRTSRLRQSNGLLNEDNTLKILQIKKLCGSYHNKSYVPSFYCSNQLNA